MKTYFSVTYRNVGHWDIYDREKRLCKIRGEAGDYCVYNDYGNIKDKEKFETVAEAMKYICEQLMAE